MTNTDIDHLADRFAALVSTETRAAVASVVEYAIEREYATGYTARPDAPTAGDASGARILAIAGIKMDWARLYIETTGSDHGLAAAAEMHLRTMVRDGLADRLCQCTRSGAGTRDGHEHRGPCENHYEADVPPVQGNMLCGSCYIAMPEV